MSQCWIHTGGAYWRQTWSPPICRQCCRVRSDSTGQKTPTPSDSHLSSPFCGGRLQQVHQDLNGLGLLLPGGSRARPAVQNLSLYQGRRFVAQHCWTDKTDQGRILCPDHCTPKHSTKHPIFYHCLTYLIHNSHLRIKTNLLHINSVHWHLTFLVLLWYPKPTPKPRFFAKTVRRQNLGFSAIIDSFGAHVQAKII